MGRQVHRKKRDVGADVGVSKALAELDAIEDADRAVWPDVDVLEPEIAMAVADATLGDAPVEPFLLVAHEGRLPPHDLLGLRGIEISRERVPRLNEVLLDVLLDGRGSREPAHLLVTARRVMEHRDAGGDRVDAFAGERSSGEQRIRPLFVTESLHMNRPVDDPAGAPDDAAPVQVARDGYEAAIDSGGEAPVEADLFLAGRETLLARAKVQKAEVHRFLDLEDVTVEQKDPRDVGLDQRDLLGGRYGGERLRAKQVVLQARRVGFADRLHHRCLRAQSALLRIACVRAPSRKTNFVVAVPMVPSTAESGPTTGTPHGMRPALEGREWAKRRRAESAGPGETCAKGDAPTCEVGRLGDGRVLAHCLNMQSTQPRGGRTAQSPVRHTVREFMTALPHTIGRKQSLASAQEKMRLSGLRHLPVLDGGLLAGVLSQRDAYFVETIAGVDPEKVAVEEAMSVDVYSVAPDTPLLDVAAEMADHKYGCAVVTQGTHVVGIFTVVDALRALVAITAAADTKTTKP